MIKEEVKMVVIAAIIVDQATGVEDEGDGAEAELGQLLSLVRFIF